MTEAVLTFSLAGALLVVLPGPDTLVMIRSMLRGGRRRAVLTAVGGLTGLCLWVSAASLGLAAVLRASEDAYYALKVAGALYLVWLGVQSVRARGSASSTPASETPGRLAAGPARGSGFGTGLVTNLLNPKVGVFFVAFLPGFVPDGMPVGATSLLLGGIYIAETAVYAAVLISLYGPVVRWMTTDRIRRRLDRLMGIVFIGFGVRLVTEH
jgi:threonine/homoserine/homoserine lactone efflux protein